MANYRTAIAVSGLSGSAALGMRTLHSLNRTLLLSRYLGVSTIKPNPERVAKFIYLNDLKRKWETASPAIKSNETRTLPETKMYPYLGSKNVRDVCFSTFFFQKPKKNIRKERKITGRDSA